MARANIPMESPILALCTHFLETGPESKYSPAEHKQAYLKLSSRLKEPITHEEKISLRNEARRLQKIASPSASVHLLLLMLFSNDKLYNQACAKNFVYAQMDEAFLHKKPDPCLMLQLATMPEADALKRFKAIRLNMDPKWEAEYLEKLIKEEPKNVLAYVKLGEIYLTGGENLERNETKARQYLGTAARIATEAKNESAVQFLEMRGFTCSTQGSFSKELKIKINNRFFQNLSFFCRFIPFVTYEKEILKKILIEIITNYKGQQKNPLNKEEESIVEQANTLVEVLDADFFPHEKLDALSMFFSLKIIPLSMKIAILNQMHEYCVGDEISDKDSSRVVRVFISNLEGIQENLIRQQECIDALKGNTTTLAADSKKSVGVDMKTPVRENNPPAYNPASTAAVAAAPAMMNVVAMALLPSAPPAEVEGEPPPYSDPVAAGTQMPDAEGPKLSRLYSRFLDTGPDSKSYSPAEHKQVYLELRSRLKGSLPLTDAEKKFLESKIAELKDSNTSSAQLLLVMLFDANIIKPEDSEEFRRRMNKASEAPNPDPCLMTQFRAMYEEGNAEVASVLGWLTATHDPDLAAGYLEASLQRGWQKSYNYSLLGLISLQESWNLKRDIEKARMLLATAATCAQEEKNICSPLKWLKDTAGFTCTQQDNQLKLEIDENKFQHLIFGYQNRHLVIHEKNILIKILQEAIKNYSKSDQTFLKKAQSLLGIIQKPEVSPSDMLDALARFFSEKETLTGRQSLKFMILSQIYRHYMKTDPPGDPAEFVKNNLRYFESGFRESKERFDKIIAAETSSLLVADSKVGITQSASFAAVLAAAAPAAAVSSAAATSAVDAKDRSLSTHAKVESQMSAPSAPPPPMAQQAERDSKLAAAVGDLPLSQPALAARVASLPLPKNMPPGGIRVADEQVEGEEPQKEEAAAPEAPKGKREVIKNR